VLGFHERLTLCCGGGVPLPVKDSTAVVLDALLTKEALSEAVPVAFGVKVTVNDAVWPAAIVNGNESPFRENSEVPVEAEETVTLEPVALSVVVILLLVPTTTPAKFSVAGAIVN
jgi:hypothetical protein